MLEPTGFLGEEGCGCQGNQRWEARASGKRLSCLLPQGGHRERGSGQADSGLQGRAVPRPPEPCLPCRRGVWVGERQTSLTVSFPVCPPRCLLQARLGCVGGWSLAPCRALSVITRWMGWMCRRVTSALRPCLMSTLGGKAGAPRGPVCASVPRRPALWAPCRLQAGAGGAAGRNLYPEGSGGRALPALVL